MGNIFKRYRDLLSFMGTFRYYTLLYIYVMTIHRIACTDVLPPSVLTLLRVVVMYY